MVILGARGSGTSTVGRLLAARLRRRFRDNDRALPARGRAASGSRKGIDRLEADLLLDHLGSRRPTVIAGSADVVDDRRVPPILEQRAVAVWLYATPDVLAARIKSAWPDPHAEDPAELRRRADARADRMAAAADLTVDVSALTPSAIIDDIVGRLEGVAPSSSPRRR